MPGSSYHPLEIEAKRGKKSELEKFREAAKEGQPHEELISLVGVDCGLNAGAIAHMTEDWLQYSGSDLKIVVPQSQKCTLGSGNEGRGGDTTNRGVPCSECKDRNTDRDWLPAQHKLPDGGDCWVAKKEARQKGREIPVRNEDTRQIVETYFRVYDDVGTTQRVKRAVKSTGKRAGIFIEGGENERDWPTTHDLRDTFGTKLAEDGFTRDEIKAAMGHASIIPADDYVDLSGRAVKNAFDDKWS